MAEVSLEKLSEPSAPFVGGVGPSAAFTPVKAEPEQARRFFLPDIDRHAGWLLPRLHLSYPHLSMQQMHGWLRSVLGSNEFMVLYLTHGVALFQSWHPTLSATPVIKQHFVWACEPENKAYQIECAEFYVMLRQWAKRMAIGRVVDLELNNDVPEKLVREKLGRLNTHTQLVATL